MPASVDELSLFSGSSFDFLLNRRKPLFFTEQIDEFAGKAFLFSRGFCPNLPIQSRDQTNDGVEVQTFWKKLNP